MFLALGEMSGSSGDSAAAAQREQKAMDAATETMLNKVNEVHRDYYLRECIFLCILVAQLR